MFTSPRPLQSQWRNLRIGLLGGSFNPPHRGHVHISRTAMRMLRLDCVWWLVSPQNPFKSVKDTASFGDRMTACRTLTGTEPRIVVSDLERHYGTVRTADTLGHLLPNFPLTEFIWISGQDDIVFNFHRWERWRDILGMIGTAHVARPPALKTIRNAPLKMIVQQNHKRLSRPGFYPLQAGNTYWLPATKLDAASSTVLRVNKAEKKIFAPGVGSA